MQAEVIPHRRPSRWNVFLLSALFAGGAAFPSYGDPSTYTLPGSATGDWTSPSSAWVLSGGDATNPYPDRAGDIARYASGNGVNASLTLSGPVTVGQIAKANGGSWTITDGGGSFTLDNTGGGTNLFGNTNAAISGTSSNGLTINVPISIANTDLDIGKTNNGSLTISGAITAVTAQNLNIRVNGANVTSNTLTLSGPVGASGAAITLNFLGADASGVGTISGNLGASVTSVTQNSVSGARMILSGDNSAFTGPINLVSGTLEAGSANALGFGGTISFSGGSLRYTAASAANDYSSRFDTSAGQAYRVDTNGQNVTWASALNSTGGSLTKGGAGTLTLAGTNTYTGSTTVSGGYVAISSNSQLGTTPASPTANNIILTGGGILATSTMTLDANRGIGIGSTTGSTGGTGNLAAASGQTLTVDGAIASAGNTGTNNLTIGNASGTTTTGTVRLTNTNNSINGTLTVNGATLEFSDPDVLGGPAALALGVNNGGAATINYTGATDITIDRNIATSGQDKTHTLASNGSGAITYSGNITNTQAGTGGAGTAGRTIALSGTNTGLNTISGTISDQNAGSTGPGLTAVNKTGAGTWVLSGNNTHGGGTTITGGTLIVASANALSSSTNTAIPQVTFAGGTLRQTTGSLLDLTGTGRTTRISASSTISGTSGNDFSFGALRNTMSGNPTLTVNTVNVTFAGLTLSNNSTNRRVTFDGSGNVTIAGEITNGTSTASGLTYAGTGRLSLQGANTYGGTTIVSSGEVRLDGGSITSSVTVADAAFGGNGAVTGNITLAAASDFKFTLAAVSDELALNGALALGDSDLELTLGGGFAPTQGQILTLVNNDLTEGITGTFASVNGGAFGAGNTFSMGGYDFQLFYDGGTGNDLTLQVLAVPEPAAIAFILAGAVLLFSRRRVVRQPVA